mmetsp:Transcript_12790/g.23054  ORF Transcript_12790/g.23054 Transcript_12790/m.23054 type:complete len:721 (+) Transcript_12790:53-2215(+)
MPTLELGTRSVDADCDGSSQANDDIADDQDSFLGQGRVLRDGEQKNKQRNAFMIALGGFITGMFIALMVTPRKGGESVACETAACIDYADRILKSMNPEVDPCEDFAEYVCGNWNYSNPIPKHKGYHTVLSKINDENNYKLKLILQSPPVKGKDHEKKAKDFYTSCMGLQNIETTGAAPMHRFKTDFLLEDWRQTWSDGNWTLSDWRKLEAILVKFHLRNIDAIFAVGVGTDDKDSTSHVMFLNQGPLSLPSRDFYIDKDRNSDQKLVALRNYVHKIVNNAFPGELAESDAVEIVDFEIEIAKVMETKVYLRNPVERYNKIAVSKLGTITSDFDLAAYVDLLAGATKLKREINHVIVPSPRFFTKLQKVLKKQKKSVVFNYLLFRLVDSFAHHLSLSFVDILFEFSKVVYGSSKKTDRWELCVSRTKTYLGFMVGRLYVERYFSPNSKALASKIIAGIHSSFRNSIASLEWMDKTTQKLALEKADAMGKKLGYPGFLLNDTQLSKFYSDFQVEAGSYIDNVMHGRNHLVSKAMEKLSAKVDPSEWQLSPATVNAYYSQSKNEIVFPAGIMQPPLFHEEYPKAVNYGSQGMVCAHEFLHAFDSSGALYGPKGNLQRWWGNDTYVTFRKKTKCLTDQYSQYQVNGDHVNGEMTLGENIADNGGVKQAFLAYQSWLKARGGEDQKLPGLQHFTSEQLFFVSYGHTWCGSRNKESAHIAIVSDV